MLKEKNISFSEKSTLVSAMVRMVASNMGSMIGSVVGFMDGSVVGSEYTLCLAVGFIADKIGFRIGC